jgi:anti-anti-sigma factor
MDFLVVQSDEQRTVVRLTGSLDAVAVTRITMDFTRHVAMHRKATVVDLSGVEFIASLGIGMLVANAQALRRHSARMVLADPPKLVEQTLRKAGIDELIPIAHGPAEVEALLVG